MTSLGWLVLALVGLILVAATIAGWALAAECAAWAEWCEERERAGSRDAAGEWRGGSR